MTFPSLLFYFLIPNFLILLRLFLPPIPGHLAKDSYQLLHTRAIVHLAVFLKRLVPQVHSEHPGGARRWAEGHRRHHRPVGEQHAQASWEEHHLRVQGNKIQAGLRFDWYGPEIRLLLRKLISFVSLV